ncbi:MAG: M20/M25/M40 family metallo-hydrolase [Planctomycetes bacterium]|nr:M20/M25/M40 family metallo-hydrolase [Planctomycetota bacterium]
MIDKKRLIGEFIRLACIGSETGDELNIAAYIASQLKSLGVKFTFDNAHKKAGGKCGNMIAYAPGSLVAPPILLAAHMDTVKPGIGVKPVIKGDIIKSDGSTILGADDKSGIAVIFETLRVLKEKKLPHRPVEIAFTISEETGVSGSKHLDYVLLKSRMGFALDDSVPGEFTVSAPAKSVLNIRVHGLEAHAAIAPERGISAIAVAAKAISRLKLGRISADTVANIGAFKAEGAVNIVNPYAEIKMEARSADTNKLDALIKQINETFQKTAMEFSTKSGDKRITARCELKEERLYDSFTVKNSSPVCELAAKACEDLGMKCRFKNGLGGTDANHFNKHGIETILLGTGMHNPHARTEYLCIPEMLRSAELAIQMLI